MSDSTSTETASYHTHPGNDGIVGDTYYPDGHKPQSEHHERISHAADDQPAAAPPTPRSSHRTQQQAAAAAKPPNSHSWGPYGGNPLAHIPSDNDNSNSARLPAFGGEFQPGLWRPQRTFANPAPLGLSGFALTTFLLSLVNLGARGVAQPNLIVGPAFAYGGLVQLLAGMWEMAVGNTFGATALASYGGFWISLGIVFTPGGFGVIAAYGGQTAEFANAFGLYLMGWFIFTFILWLCTLRSTLAFSSLLLTVWITFLLLGISYLDNKGTGAANVAITRAGGAFGIVAAFIAWYNTLAGLTDSSNSFFVVPILHFPWSAKGREMKAEMKGE
ncbi:uncharacterized protein K452DRAFT_244072 [Aplosporella prunicola CBS 121167]|uniref:Uncharacterized protein n=1 Tax=Aplosporella prunicola CBS 121167 TaxID=1176127 RepID=A0A6A6BNM5_9PEZI|nr:uncharacterized protein K452DRAFT_244072 [Aplosporella prunicola CBS 121167]KAF2145749.1 hypothetical protein K452DRAFT_244072 [Aplosporella prunicola CBS 121167]